MKQTLFAKRKQHKTNTLHTKDVPYNQKKRVKTGSFTRIFPAYGFGNPQTYKIKSKSVDDLCPYYKIKQIFDILIYFMNICIYVNIS